MQAPTAKAAAGMMKLRTWAAAASAGAMARKDAAAIMTQRRMYATRIHRMARLYERARRRAVSEPREASLKRRNGSRYRSTCWANGNCARRSRFSSDSTSVSRCRMAVRLAQEPAPAWGTLRLPAVPRDNLHDGRLRALVAQLRREPHLGADGQAVEVVMQHAVAVEIELAVVIQRTDETVAFVLEYLLDGAMRLAVGVRLFVMAAQRYRFLQLLLDGGERLVDD